MVSKSVFILYWAFEIPLFSFWLFWGMNQHLCITMSINWPLCDLIHWDLFGLVPSKYEGNSTGASFFFFTHKKRTAKIFWYPSNTSTAHITDMLRLTTFGGNDAKLDRFLKRLEGAASHFGSPPQIRMALVCSLFTCSWTWERRCSQTQSRRWGWNLKDDLSLSWALHCLSRLGICQKKLHDPIFCAKEFYTLKTRKSRLLSPAINSENVSLIVIWPSFG